MKRSEINKAIQRALKMLEDNDLRLPMFAYWTPEQWRANSDITDNINKVMLGWDVTDHGRDFANYGAVLFTVRNGLLTDAEAGTPYAEKLIFLQDGCEKAIPFHYHLSKTEDIINRSNAILEMQMYCSNSEKKLDETSDVRVKMDGVWRVFKPGSIIEIEKGSSITIHPGLYHRFCAKTGSGDLIVGEVSSINDDNTDNVYLEELRRFTEIQEDEAPIYPLCNEKR